MLIVMPGSSVATGYRSPPIYGAAGITSGVPNAHPVGKAQNGAPRILSFGHDVCPKDRLAHEYLISSIRKIRFPSGWSGGILLRS